MQTIKKKAYAAKPHQEQEIVTLANKVSKIVGVNRKIITIAAGCCGSPCRCSGISLKGSMDERSAVRCSGQTIPALTLRKDLLLDLAKAVDLFREIHKKYPSTVSGRMAALYVANSLAGLDRKDEALKEYQSVTREYASDNLWPGSRTSAWVICTGLREIKQMQSRPLSRLIRCSDRASPRWNWPGCTKLRETRPRRRKSIK